ncbi:hypothetical protein [Aureimonas sp. AU12]|uniref:hypothetical protein n=1 Tax=Aureimonas sp. AU12 TaxID=1638161 RepID=UPI0012E33AF2|nr:hypothetical protein [Aureimonas sp. AU12]
MDLFEDAPLFAGPVRHVADTLATSKGRGRPKGAANKRTTQMRDTLLKMGFQHPMMNLAALANADPVRLSAELACDRLDAANMILKANAELLPYFESKRPTEVHVEERSLGVLVVGDMTTKAVADGVFSLTGIVGESDTDQ